MKKSNYPRREYHTDDINKIPCDGCIILPICISEITPRERECYESNTRRIFKKSWNCSKLGDFITYDLLHGKPDVADGTYICASQIHKVLRWLYIRKERIRNGKRQK